LGFGFEAIFIAEPFTAPTLERAISRAADCISRALPPPPPRGRTFSGGEIQSDADSKSIARSMLPTKLRGGEEDGEGDSPASYVGHRVASTLSAVATSSFAGSSSSFHGVL